MLQNRNRLSKRRVLSCLLAGLCMAAGLLIAVSCSTQPGDSSAVSTPTEAPANSTTTPEILRREGYLQDTLFTFTTLSSNQELEGLMQADGTILIPAEYEEINPLTAERYLAKQQDSYELLNREGTALLTAAYLRSFDGVRSEDGVYEEGVLVAAASREGDLLREWFLADLDGKEIGTQTWDTLMFHSRGYIHAVRDQKDYLIDYQGNTVVDFAADVFVDPAEEGKPLQKTERIVTYFDVDKAGDSHSYYGVRDSAGNTILPAEYDYLLILSPTRIVAQKGSVNADESTAWIVDETGRVISDGEYNTLEFSPLSPSEYSESGIAYVSDPDTGIAGFYLVDQDGNRVVDQLFDSLSFTTADQLSATVNGESYTMDLQGNRIE